LTLRLVGANVFAVDAHALAELRSLAYHREVARRIVDDPTVIARARARVREWSRTLHPVPEYARAWAVILDQPAVELVRFLEEDSERARELRQSTPFAGALSPQERWRIWRDVREREDA